MKKNLFSIALLTALTFMVGSCSDDDDPKPKVLDYLQVGTDSRPTNWTFSDNRDYESRMTVQVELGDTLAAYQSSMDLYCPYSTNTILISISSRGRSARPVAVP